MINKKFRDTVFVCACSMLAGSITQAAEVEINNLMTKSGDEFWLSYDYIGPSITKSLNEASSQLMEAGHYALSLDQSSKTARTIYLFTAGLAHYKFQWANSIFFNHEYVHFSRAHAAGLTDHYFQLNNGERISNAQAYMNILLTGAVGGPATSGGSAATTEDLNDMIFAGVNAQMQYSENFVKTTLFDPDSKNAFDGTDFLMNRMYTQSYALGDLMRYRDSHDKNGDIYKFSDHLKKNHGIESGMEKIIALSFVSNILSPATRMAWSNITQYMSDADVNYDVRTINTPLGPTTYDIPHYLNADSFSLAPALYVDVSRGIGAGFGSDKMLVSAGVDFAALGEADPDFNLYASNEWGALTTEISTSSSKNGNFVDANFSFALTDHIAINGGAAFKNGETLRGARNLGSGDELFYFGTAITF